MISNATKQRYYGDRKYNGTLLFYDWLREISKPSFRVLNLGAGPTPDIKLRSLKGEVAEVVGADIDPVVLTNSELDRAIVIKDGRLDLETESFDLVYSDYVLEHIEKPLEFLSEVRRVLKPGSSYLFRTPNFFHYVAISAAITPQSFHRLVANRMRGLGEEEHEPWKTYYRMNSPSTLRRLGQTTGFGSIELRLIEPNPSYLEFHAIPFYAGLAYERLVNSHAIFSGMRCNILGRFTKLSAVS